MRKLPPFVFPAFLVVLCDFFVFLSCYLVVIFWLPFSSVIWLCLCSGAWSAGRPGSNTFWSGYSYSKSQKFLSKWILRNFDSTALTISGSCFSLSIHRGIHNSYPGSASAIIEIIFHQIRKKEGFSSADHQACERWSVFKVHNTLGSTGKSFTRVVMDLLFPYPLPKMQRWHKIKSLSGGSLYYGVSSQRGQQK